MTLGKLIKLLVPPLGHNSVCVKEILRVYRKVLCEKYKLNREEICTVHSIHCGGKCFHTTFNDDVCEFPFNRHQW